MIDVDFSRPRTACQTPGCGWPTWHICLVGKEDLTQEILKKEAKAPKKKRKSVYRGTAWKAQISMGQLERWAKVHAQTRARDLNIVQMRKDGFSNRAIGEQYGIDGKTVSNIIKRMQKEIDARGESSRVG